MTSYQWPAVAGSGGSGVTVYANLAAFPAASSVDSGTLAVAADTSYLYESNAASWLLIANATTVTDVAAATALNTASTIVKRNGSGNFAAGTITASLTGLASLNLPLTGGALSGALAMGGSKITGLGAPTVNGDALRYDQLGANSGIATLDSGGKVPIAQLPASLMEYQGTWNASTNTPTLADGTGTSGYYYRVQVAGTQNLGSGSLTFVVGDWVMYDGSIWQMAHAGADAVTSVNGSAGVVTVNAINQLTGDVTASAASGSQSKASALVATTNATLTTLSALVSVGTITTGTWSATTIAVNKGGTGVTSVTTAPAASAWAGWDANKNLSAQGLIEGYTTTATAAGTTTLTVGSTFQQYFTGSTTQTVVLPVASTLVLGQQFQIVNLSTGLVTVQSSGANSVQVLSPNMAVTFTCILASGTTAASWSTTGAGAPGNTTGNGIAATYVGENSLTGLTQRSGTGGSIYSIRFTSNLGTSATKTTALTLNKGVYLISGGVTAVSSSGGTDMQAYLAIGGTQVSSTYEWQVLAAGSYAFIAIPGVPVVISADSTEVAIYARSTAATSSGSTVEMYAVRIA